MRVDMMEPATVVVPLAQRNLPVQQQQLQQQPRVVTSRSRPTSNQHSHDHHYDREDTEEEDERDSNERDDQDMRDTSSPEPTTPSLMNPSSWWFNRSAAARRMLGSAIHPIARPPAAAPVPSSSKSMASISLIEESREDDFMDDADCVSSNKDKQDSSRIHEPLKRFHQDDHQLHHQLQQQDPVLMTDTDTDDEWRRNNQNKRRRVNDLGDYTTNTFLEKTRMGFYNAIPALNERQQILMEYTAPSALTPMFYWLDYTPFALAWVVFMLLIHAVQVLDTDFTKITSTTPVVKKTTNNNNNNHFWNNITTIGPLTHLLMDAYLWNNPLIITMLLRPDLFGESAYWVVIIGFICPQQASLAVSLKTHYNLYKPQILALHSEEKDCDGDDQDINNSTTNNRTCHAIERRLMDIFILYTLADVLFIVAKLWNLKYLLWIGIVQFFLSPLYLIWSHKQRIDRAINAIGNNGKAKKVEAIKKDN